MRNKCKILCKFDLMHSHDLLDWLKRPDLEIVQISILILILVFSYDLSDTQDGHKCWGNEIYIMWLTRG